MNEMVSVFDQKFSGKGAVACPNEGQKVMLPQSKRTYEQHGAMVVHGSASYLVCGVCGANQPIGRI